MKSRKMWQGAIAFAGLFVLILDGKTAVSGAQTGIKLCLQTVIPSLFPFFLLSIVLTDSVSGLSISIFKPICRILRVPSGGESFLLTGFLGGYPVGAQCIGEAYHSGKLSKGGGIGLLRFCNNAGPAFLFGMVSRFFESKEKICLLWFIQILSALLVSFCYPVGLINESSPSRKQSISFSDALKSSLKVTATVCGWITIFRVFISFLEKWILWIFPPEVKVFIIGLLELSNGCCELSAITDERLRFIICSCMLSFGGVCVSMQTSSVIYDLPLFSYIQGKLLQTFFSFSLCCITLYHPGYVIPFALLIFMFLLYQSEKKSRIPVSIVV